MVTSGAPVHEKPEYPKEAMKISVQMQNTGRKIKSSKQIITNSTTSFLISESHTQAKISL